MYTTESRASQPFAIRAGAMLLHQDADFDAIAQHAPLAIATT
jgi:hypothetical protein